MDAMFRENNLYLQRSLIGSKIMFSGIKNTSVVNFFVNCFYDKQ